VIGKDEIAEGIRYADAEAEEHNDFPAYWAKRDVDAEGLSDVAMQRALRVLMIEKGISPNQIRPLQPGAGRADQAYDRAQSVRSDLRVSSVDPGAGGRLCGLAGPLRP
jgi:hypothetical protein